MERSQAYAPRIYFIHPLLAGPLETWAAHLDHAAALGFDHVLIGSPFAPGRAGHLQLVADYCRLHPALKTDTDVDEALHRLADAARTRGLALLIEIVIDRAAADGALFHAHSHWFRLLEPGEALPDPRHARSNDNAVYANFDDPVASAQLGAWWSERLIALVQAGIAGFCFDSPHRVPVGIWREFCAAVRTRHPDARFLAATPGLSRSDLAQLAGVGFDSVFSSLRWWDFRADWLVDEHAALVRVGAPIAFPDAPYGPRLAADFASANDAIVIERAYRRAMAAAVALGTGWLMPMGFEYGVAEPLSYRAGSAERYRSSCAAAQFDLSVDVAQANALQQRTPLLQSVGELRALSPAGADVAILLRGARPDLRNTREAALFIANAELSTPAFVEPARFLDGVPGGFTAVKPLASACTIPSEPLEAFVLGPGESHLFRASATPCVTIPYASKRAEAAAVAQATAAPRLAIERVSPCVDGGRFVVKRIVGEEVEVSAAIFGEGHDKIAAAVIWRAADEIAWRETPMTPAQPAGLDLWHARIWLTRIGRYEFTVIAWRDDFASLVDHIRKKLNANQAVDLELEEARHLLARILAEAETADTADTTGAHQAMTPEHNAHGTHEALHPTVEQLRHIATQFAHVPPAARLDLILAPQTSEAVASARHRPFLSRDITTYRIDAERSAARFASWYEIFPRSMSDDPTRHGTFDDVIAKLPRIRDLGFDVLYFPPIHPIGKVNRKGRNNTLIAQPGDVGSPYAIGSDEGGHTALHPDLGTFDDFKRMLAAAQALGLEIALDFAIQCAPDHPWLTEHASWFAWRPDGTLRYAENPPKKYQDIVNPEFYAYDAKPALWLALRDVIRFWVDSGVRIFRVDNPHTKPLPFWEWMIADIRSRRPDIIFLSEAFTRPRLMYRLAKIGFSQSYTYFTWRESKRDFVDYLTELTQTDVREYFRPQFFVNTPDINPRHLQSSGRAGFMIRAALAATLSGLWGMYSGFELCEAKALPHSEEYLDSEKYQLRAWDWDRPGNIVDVIAALNRIRRMNPALHTHLNVTFLPAHNERILFFEKATAARDNVILVAISLDPFEPQEADIELPWQTLEHWRVKESDALAVTELVSGACFQWRGRRQPIRIEPDALPFAIWRIAPTAGFPRDERAFSVSVRQSAKGEIHHEA
ncbi:MAG TPA: maltotransferase domain-containing protein [Trinickia sp.]|uniref:maltotransferase domain-containing protein n=1 Tax=Trinickia sp. TaxID=2571163 RepID=UPI002BD2F899|nr:maltotransferase domain-containing protein [Trinickia sp.]HTI19050.1 maltotransferase domain-containing protein [Trinickia sp.]